MVTYPVRHGFVPSMLEGSLIPESSPRSHVFALGMNKFVDIFDHCTHKATKTKKTFCVPSRLSAAVARRETCTSHKCSTRNASITEDFSAFGMLLKSFSVGSEMLPPQPPTITHHQHRQNSTRTIEKMLTVVGAVPDSSA